MSSHHFVREDQEPALLMLEAQASPFEVVGELLEWSPTVMVHESALAEILTWGIKVDVVIVSSDNIQSWKETLHDQFPVKIISFQGKNDAVSTALNYLVASKQKAVNILSQQPLGSFESFSTLDLSVIQWGKRWSYIRSGIFEKWLPAGRIVRVLSGGEEDQLTVETDSVIIVKRPAGFWVSED